MATANRVMLLGYVGRDAEYRQSGGLMIANLSIATNRRIKQPDGQYTDEPEWHRVVCFNQTAEFARQYVVKGSQVLIEGPLRYRTYIDKAGVERTIAEIHADKVLLTGSRGDNVRPQAKPQTKPQAKPAQYASNKGDPDDVPF